MRHARTLNKTKKAIEMDQISGMFYYINFLLIATRLPQGQFWATIKEAASLTRC